MTKVCRIKSRTINKKKRRGFLGKKFNRFDKENIEMELNDNPAVTILTDSNTTTVDNNSVNNESGLNLFSISASVKKVKPIESSRAFTRMKIYGYRIIDCSILSDIFFGLACPQCGECSSLSLSEKMQDKKGLASKLLIKCFNCNYENEFYTSKQCNRGYDINCRTVYAMRALGQGHSGMKKFTTLMNMPQPMTQNNYDKLAVKIGAVAQKVAEDTMFDAVSELRKHANNDEICDIGVSCDGTWQRRGFSSLNGVFSALSMDTGKVLDVEPMSRFCKGCFLKKDLLKTNPTAYAQWRNSHICKNNYKGSASGMETTGAKHVFLRSIDKYKLRYVNFLGDGDSKSFNNVIDTYPGIQVNKLECVGHYQKRVGTRLRNLKKREKGLGGRGCLTDAVIDRLQNFFGVAIRQNAGNLAGMKASALATLFHVASSKTNNLHFPHCPTGINSWCKFNFDKANKTNTYKPGPGLPMNIIFKIRPIFEDLSKDSELKKCLHGKTQNANESFNSMIWDRLPKTRYVSLANLKFGVYDAVANFNIGMKASVLVFEQLNMLPGAFMVKGSNKINNKRIKQSIYRMNENNKLRRQLNRAKKMTKNDNNLEKEGITYEPGGF